MLGAAAGFALEAAGIEAPGQILAVALATTALGAGMASGLLYPLLGLVVSRSASKPLVFGDQA
jgi:hypothetical protein